MVRRGRRRLAVLPDEGGTGGIASCVVRQIVFTEGRSFSPAWAPDSPVLLLVAPTFETPAGRDDLRNLARIAAAHPDLACIGVSVDLPFALVRVLDETRPPENVTLLSAFRSPEFGMEYGTLLVDHPMMGLLARAVILLDAAHRVAWTHLVPDVLSAPDWPALESRLA